jgi:hypothetical protein
MIRSVAQAGPRLRQLVRMIAGVAILGTVFASVVQSAASERQPNLPQPRSELGAFKTTVDYVTHFYPLWFTYYQSILGTHNRLIGPERITPVYKVVVAINVDTLYASTFLDLTAEPIILTIPPTTTTYSVLTLDAYCDIFQSGIPAQTAGTYALTGPGFSGKLPPGVIRISMPLNFSTLIFRADKASSTGEDLTKEAQAFRTSLTTETLSDYKKGVPPTATAIFPVAAFAISYKTLSDKLIAERPIAFLKQLQTAVKAPQTPPLSPHEQVLSDKFDALFGDGDLTGAKEFEVSAGGRAALDLILSQYLTHTDRNNWIHFTNIGDWGRQVIQRSSISAFIQYGNGISTAAYYHAFRDNRGRPLDGTDPRGYLLRIPKSKIPEAKRFWSVTAYTPEAIELIRNDARTYDIASYTPGLHYNADGSLSIYLAIERPPGVPKANWLPVSSGAFNIMLRVYGPQGDVSDNTYVPPGIQKR